MSLVRIDRYAKPGMASVNTYWLETENGLIVIDGQRELSSARAAHEQMSRSGKPILAVFLTHPHPDHFGGIGVFSPEGSHILVYGSAQTRASIEADRWGLVKASHEVVGDDFPAEMRLPTDVLADNQPVTIDGLTIDRAGRDGRRRSRGHDRALPARATSPVRGRYRPAPDDGVSSRRPLGSPGSVSFRRYASAFRMLRRSTPATESRAQLPT